MKKIISIMLCIMLSVSMMTACGSKESDNDKKDVGSETKQDVKHGAMGKKTWGCR